VLATLTGRQAGPREPTENHSGMRRLVVPAVLAVLAAALPAAAAPKDVPPGQLKRIQCHDDEDTAKPLQISVEGETATGRYTLPAQKNPSTLVVFGHGYGHDSASWVDHMRNAAAEHGVVSVTMDYRGTHRDKDANVRGWFVKEGADDMIAATKIFLERCPSIGNTIIFGVSMGGNSTGLAVARAGREDGAADDPLFDYWFNIEGAVNVLETYAGASALAPANGFASNAKTDIEAEMGGKTLAEDPEGYADLAVVSHMDEIAASGVKGVVMVHALEDGLVPYNQSREFVPLLLGNGIPVEMYTAGRHEGETGTTITGYSGNNGSPLAGHASEKSQRHIVMTTALARLWELVDDGTEVEAYMEYLVDPEAGTFPPR
jgi:dipeptidyl aminopeptidase/acylaminoacyl peptidase